MENILFGNLQLDNTDLLCFHCEPLRTRIWTVYGGGAVGGVPTLGHTLEP